MADMNELILTIVRPLVSHPEELALVTVDSEEFLEYHLSVHPDDIGRVIGKKGRVAKAIRTVVYSVKVSGPKRVRLTIVDS
ncbi:MAG: KH domain-containing protein [Carnobacterium sp.]|uniref:RNA-binding protein KhpA n=1 Tax=Carnobacterium antarcticum TaxID=2126436 RepID=A0ABW4NMV0_9LACT|nr:MULTISPECIES: KH domain-containing protein [unclassified Carnobacterium]ALV20963.1 KH domain RNA binding protein YlqC [Carnobacterium sp. CP1]QQP71117.1 KH domain-containing protein [Carnobacterium sp. CS13]